MSRALLVLDSRFQRQKAADWCWSLKDGTRVEFKAPKRSDDQNSKMWAMLTEVSVQLKWHGIKLTPDDWKLQFLDALRRAHGEQVRVVPNTDNSGFVNLGTSSSDLSKDEMSDMIELIYKFGAEHGVKFNDPHSGEDQPAQPEEGENPGQVTTDAAPSSVLSADDLAWLKLATKMMWAATGKGEQDLLRSTFEAVKTEYTPENIGKLARDKGMAIYKRCKAVCFGEAAAGDVLEEIVLIAGCEVGEIVG